VSEVEVASLKEAEQARRELAKRLRALPGFAGVGLVIDDDQMSLKVNFTDRPSNTVPEKWLGFPVTTDVVGHIRAY
jgi:hypothetical protein